MSTAQAPILLPDVQHLVLSDVSWELYQHLLAEIGDRSIRVTYNDGELEIMSPLPKHEKWGARIGRLIEMLALERGIPIESLGSTTFRSAARRTGLEPDECYYIQHADAARAIEDGFDATIHPPPDLAVEIDITRRSVGRQPIYAALRVPELWRFDGERLEVLRLNTDGEYEASDASSALPFLPMPQFVEFLHRLAQGPQLVVLEEFRHWVRSL